MSTRKELEDRVDALRSEADALEEKLEALPPEIRTVFCVINGKVLEGTTEGYFGIVKVNGVNQRTVPYESREEAISTTVKYLQHKYQISGRNLKHAQDEFDKASKALADFTAEYAQ